MGKKEECLDKREAGGGWEGERKGRKNDSEKEKGKNGLEAGRVEKEETRGINTNPN